MRVASLELKTFRGITGTVNLSAPLAIIVGENNSGKSAIIDALRLLTVNAGESYPSLRPHRNDFSFDANGALLSDNFTVSLILSDLTDVEQGQMITCLAPGLGKRTARISMESRLLESGKITTRRGGGDLFNTDIEPHCRSAVSSIYLHPLRDAIRDLQPGPYSRVSQLIVSFVQQETEKSDLESVLEAANAELLKSPPVARAQTAMVEGLERLTGTEAYRQTASLKFSAARFDRVIRNLRALMGSSAPMDLDTNGLGYSNLLYMAVLLSVLRQSTEGPLQILLVEEPEAHLHPQLQELLLRYLKETANERVQVIASTHSPQLASSADLRAVTIMKSRREEPRGATHLADVPLSKKHAAHIRRFLDATKAALLFAKGVILVEGMAEQLVLPSLASRLGIDLQAEGIAVVNVGGLAFEPFAALFCEAGLQARCVILTDGDPKEEAQGSESASQLGISAAANKILQLHDGDRVFVALSLKTFEWDLAYASAANQPILLSALKLIHPVKAKRLAVSDDSRSNAWASGFLQALEETKGAFAQELVDVLEGVTEQDAPQCPIGFKIPPYIEDALNWLCSGRVSADQE